jgi:hypothetical protein
MRPDGIIIEKQESRGVSDIVAVGDLIWRRDHGVKGMLMSVVV